MPIIPQYYRTLSRKRGEQNALRRAKARARRREHQESLENQAETRNQKARREIKQLDELFGGLTYANVLKKWLPPNISYLTSCKASDFYLDFNTIVVRTVPERRHFVPNVFSLIDNPKESFKFLRRVLLSLLCEQSKRVVIDYRNCRDLSIGAQVLLDIILSDVFHFYSRCVEIPRIKRTVGITKEFVGSGGSENTPRFVEKILFSVGSFAIHTNQNIDFPDIIPYALCTHNRGANFNRVKAMERKDVDTTALADYVIDSLAKMGKKLTIEALENLCIVIGEVLINAEEHATTQHRFSIGYFQDMTEDGQHVGIFRLAILNFGKTIYEKFKDPACPNKAVVEKMNALSKQYTGRSLFASKEFEEETLWTLYALQDGITSVADRKRGHGSIQFMDSFFKLNGRDGNIDPRSRMTIHSGRTSITLNNRHAISEETINGERVKVMTFNDTNTFNQRPDKENVKFVENYFPGTMISAKIIFDEEDFSAI